MHHQPRPLLFLLALLGAWSLMACQHFDHQAYKKAAQTHTLDSYQEYLQKHPDGLHTQEAHKQMARIRDEAAFQHAKAQHTLDSYNGYLQRHPNGAFASKAQQAIHQIQDAAAFQQTKAQHTLDSYNNYLQNFSDGAYRAEAQRQIAKLQDVAAFQQAKQQHTLDSYNSYLQNFPNGDHRTEAQQALQALLAEQRAFAHAQQQNTRDAYASFLQHFPSGNYVATAKRKIAEFDDLALYQQALKQGTLWGLREYLGLCSLCLKHGEILQSYPHIKYVRLKITIHSASITKSFDAWTKSDPFLVVQNESTGILTTPKRDDDHNPTWNEYVIFDYKIGNRLLFILYDADVTKHEFMGHYETSFSYREISPTFSYIYTRRLGEHAALRYTVQVSNEATYTSHTATPSTVGADTLIAIAVGAALTAAVVSQRSASSKHTYEQCATAVAADKVGELYETNSTGQRIVKDAAVEVIKKAILKTQPTLTGVAAGVALQAVKREITQHNPRLGLLFDSADFLRCLLK